jgi:hypothetical protein
MAYINYIEKNFSASSEAIIAQADRICRAYADDGYDLTLRQLYYQFVSMDLIANKQTEYKRLGSIINDARLAGRIDWNHITDRTRELKSVGHWDTPADIIDAVAKQYAIDRWSDQPVRVEVWVEKEALAGVVGRAARSNDVAYFACKGYTSQSELWGAAQRLGEYIEAGQRVVILHLGDHDPSGIDMTRDIEDRLKLFIARDFARARDLWIPDSDDFERGTSKDDRDFETEEALNDVWNEIVDHIDGELADRDYDDADRWLGDDALEIRRIALNMNQVRQYNPPPNPAKFTDSRAAGYVAEFGHESWELDALNPRVLNALIQTEIDGLRDDELWVARSEVQAAERAVLREVSQNWEQVVETFPVEVTAADAADDEEDGD